MATQEEINHVVAIAADKFGLAARAQRLLRIAFEILVFEIGPPNSVTENNLLDIVMSGQAGALLAEGESSKLRRYLKQERDGRPNALAVLRILSHPQDVRSLLSGRLPGDVQSNVGPLLDKD